MIVGLTKSAKGVERGTDVSLPEDSLAALEIAGSSVASL